MIDQEDLNRISESQLVFPIDEQRMISILEQISKTDMQLKLEIQLDKLMIQLNDCRSTLRQWNLETFTINELKETIDIYGLIEKELQEFLFDYKQFNEDVQIVNQPIQALKQKLLLIQNIKQETSDKISDLREKEYQKTKIKSVQYRNQPIKVIKNSATGAVKQIGYDSLKDLPLEVLKIPKVTWLLNDQNILFTTMEAQFELYLSSHFQKYLGNNILQDEDYYLHFLQLVKGRTLKKLLKTKKTTLKPENPFFLHLIKDLFDAFKDLYEYTKYMPDMPIKLKNVLILNEDYKVILYNLKFSRIRHPEQDSPIRVQARLLENFANLLLQILEISVEELKKIEYFITLKKLLEAMVWAEEDTQLYERKLIQNLLTFSELKKHELLDKQNGFNSEDIQNDFKTIFGHDN